MAQFSNGTRWQISVIRKLAAEDNVGRSFAQKVVDKLMIHGNVLDPKDWKKEAKYLPGARLFDFFNELVLLALQEQDPQRTLASYKTTLTQISGASVSKSTISNWFKNRFEFKGCLRTAKVVPSNKDRPANIIHFLTVTPPSGF